MNRVRRSKEISRNLLPFLFTVFTCIVSLKSRAACSSLFSSLFRAVSRQQFSPFALRTPDTWVRKQKARRFCTHTLNIWPCLRILCIWCRKAVWPQHGKKNADVSHIQWTASQLTLSKTNQYPKNQRSIQRCGHFRWTTSSRGKFFALILWPFCFQSVSSMWRALASHFCFVWNILGETHHWGNWQERDKSHKGSGSNWFKSLVFNFVTGPTLSKFVFQIFLFAFILIHIDIFWSFCFPPQMWLSLEEFGPGANSKDAVCWEFGPAPYGLCCSSRFFQTFQLEFYKKI